MSNKTVTPWDCDAIQFPRLISEISAANLIQYSVLTEAMDLRKGQIDKLLGRARIAAAEINSRATTKPNMYAVVLDDRFVETERGNIWLTNDDEPGHHNVWIGLQGDIWLEITIRPANYPGLTVQTIQISDKELAAHINKNFGGGTWVARKCNIDGVIFQPDDATIKGKA